MMFAMVLFGLGIIFSFGVDNVSAASPIYVSTHGNNSWNGQNSTWINGTLNGPKATIKNATGTVTSGGTVYIAKGTYNENNININKNMTIIGAGQDNTIINGTNKGPIFIFPYGYGEKVTIENLTLTNGSTGYIGGGAIDNFGGNLTVKDCTFSDNTATGDDGLGGAINNGAILNVTDSTFKGNTATYGGAIANIQGTLTVIGSTFTDNTVSSSTGAGGAGAIGNEASLDVIDSIFTDNSANLVGGAIRNDGTGTVTGSTFKGNTATGNDDGGGAIENDSTLTVKGSNFTGNTAPNGYGGGIYNYGGTLTVKGSTLTGNTAIYGGAIANNVNNATVHFNQIVDNTASQGSAIYNNYGGKVNASLNWWGCNVGANVAKQIYTGNGTVTYGPWIILTITATPGSVYVNGTSTITADLLHDNNGVYENPANGVVPYTGYADFKTTKGTITNVKFVNGKATSTLKDLTTAGVATVTATVDGKIVTTKVTTLVRSVNL